MPSNVLVFLTDDHAQWAAGCYGNTEIRTPTLDHLASTGVRFENAYTPSPVCSPARACFFTGKLPSQHGIHDYLAESDPEVQAVDWLGGQATLASILQGEGYVTGLCGKWHLGNGEQKPEGFDFWFSQSAAVSEPEGYDAPWPRTELPTAGYDRHGITDRAVEFLRNRDADRPFFLTVGYLATHSPWTGHPERLVDQYRQATFRDIPEDPTYPFGRLRSESLYPTRSNPREALAQYYASVTDIDEQIGRVMDELEMLSLREDTLVIYTSDHGLNAGHHGIWGKGNGTLPYNMVEESIRVPLIVSHPTGILGRQVRQEPVTHCDTFMSILETAGIPLPSSSGPENYPGRSYRPALLGQSLLQWTDAVFGEYGNLRMVRTKRLKLIRRYPDGPHELIDLVEDPREQVNVIDDQRYAEVLNELDLKVDAYFENYSTPEHSGRDVLDQPRHNKDEAWRDNSEPKLEEDSRWLTNLEAGIQKRRQLKA